MKIDILGVKIDDVKFDEALDEVSGWLKKKDKHYIVTPNPEFIVAAQEDREFREILNQADLSIPDSSSLGFSSWLLKRNRLTRFLLWPFFFLPTKQVMQFDVVTGTDFMEALCKMAAENGFTTGFLGGKDEIAKKTAECLNKKYPKLKISYVLDGPVIPAKPARPAGGAGIYTNKELWIPDQVRDDKVDILFVAFGHIKQEKWIAKNLPNLPVKVAMGVGGAFDYLSGSTPRAPKWLRNIGFEWLFRLIVQPWRIKRQLALLKYLGLLLLSSPRMRGSN